MSYGSSTIPAFTDALKASLEARIAAAEGSGAVPVYDGPPATAAEWGRPEWIMLGDVQGDGHIEVFDRASQPRDEDYTLMVYVSVARAGRASDVSARAWAIYDYLNQELRTTPRQGVAGVKWSYVFVHAVAKRTNDRVREFSIEAGVQVRARI